MAAIKECVIVLDGANVACQKDGKAHIAKLAAAIDYFHSLNTAARCYPVKCVAFAPNFWLNVKRTVSQTACIENMAMETEDWELLNELVQKDHVILTPSQAHDDFYVIDYAVKHNGFIVTNDMFRDHVSNNRIFHGKRLTSNWVRMHCIDFTFVGQEFMPNPRAMERVLSFQPSAMISLASATSNAESSQSSVQKMLSNNEDDAEVAGDDVNENEMVIDNASTKRRKNIELTEVTYYKVPRELLPMLQGKGGETMDRFQEEIGVYVVLPSYAVASSSPSATPQSNVLTLSIYGPEASRLQAVGELDAFLVQMQIHHQNTLQQQQQIVTPLHPSQRHPRQQQYAARNGTQDDNMMEIDPF